MLPSQECLPGLFLGVDRRVPLHWPTSRLAPARAGGGWAPLAFLLLVILAWVCPLCCAGGNTMENMLSQRCLSFWNIWSKPRLNSLERRKHEWKMAWSHKPHFFKEQTRNNYHNLSLITCSLGIGKVWKLGITPDVGQRNQMLLQDLRKSQKSPGQRMLGQHWEKKGMPS